MAFRPGDIAALVRALPFTVWFYRTQDQAIDVQAAGYFTLPFAQMRQGDFMFVNAGIETATPTYGVLAITGTDDISVLAVPLGTWIPGQPVVDESNIIPPPGEETGDV